MNPKAMLKDYQPRFSSKRKIKKDEIYFGINSTFSFLLAFITILFIYLIWILNVNATQGYDIRKLEYEKQNLLQSKETLDAQISNLESLKNIEKLNDFNSIMEKVEDPDFIVIRNGVNYAYNN